MENNNELLHSGIKCFLYDVSLKFNEASFNESSKVVKVEITNIYEGKKRKVKETLFEN